MNDNLSSAIELIAQNAVALTTKKIVAGFDGFIDSIVRIIKNKEEHKQAELFKTTNDFGDYISAKSGSSFSLEIEEVNSKLGGNMPITANALAKLGTNVTSIGALGYPQINPLFNELAATTNCYSFADPGTATAFEFDDGKIILAQMKALNETNWATIKNIIGIDILINAFAESDLYCILNWSEIDSSTDIWKGILKDVLPFCNSSKKKIVFFDISDCSKRSNAAINEMLSLLKEFSEDAEVILSLNKNESNRIYEVLNGNLESDLKNTGEKIYNHINVDTLVLHTSSRSISFSEKGCFEAESFFVANPVLSTGAGDNFNAGFIAAKLMNLDAKTALIFANAVASLYIQTSLSKNVNDVINFLKAQNN